MNLKQNIKLELANYSNFSNLLRQNNLDHLFILSYRSLVSHRTHFFNFKVTFLKMIFKEGWPRPFQKNNLIRHYLELDIMSRLSHFNYDAFLKLVHNNEFMSDPFLLINLL